MNLKSKTLKNTGKDTVKTAKQKRNKIKPIVLWALIDNANPDVPVTFTATHEDAMIALDQYLYLKHYKHFRQWCPLHGYENVDHTKAWLEYSRTALAAEFEGEPLYTVVEIDYEPNVIASLLRSVNGCMPLGCPFDTDEELNEFSEKLATKTELVDQGKDTLTPLEEALTLLFDDLDEAATAASVKEDITVQGGHFDA